MRKMLIGIAAILSAACAPSAPAARSTPPSGGTLLVGNKAENTLSFIQLADGRELGRSPTGAMPHEIAISPDGRQAAVVAYGGQSIDIFDVPSRAKLRTIDLAPNQGPHGLLWLDDGRLVATTERSRSLTVVDTRKDDKVSSIATGQEGTHMVAVSPDKALAYTANIGSGTVSVIDLANGRKLRDIPVGGRPEGIALARNGRDLWVGDLEGAHVRAYDTETFELITDVPTGPVTIRVLTSPDERWVVTSNIANGSVSVIDAASRRKVRDIVVSGSGEAAQVTLLFSPDGRRLYAAETGRDVVAEIDFASGEVLRRLPAGKNGDGLAIAP